MPLFAPLAALLSGFEGVPDVDVLNRLAAARPPVTSGGGKPLRFVASNDERPYELRVFESGEVPTRPGDWHDAYNALCWMIFPQVKSALNARHAAHFKPGPRGALRDAATQFDECGVVVLHAAPHLAAALQAHEWHEAFWSHRDELISSMRFLVLGHALYERLRAPYIGLCGKALYLEAPQSILDAPVDIQLAHADSTLSAALADPGFCVSPSALHPLPVLGIPGVTPDNDNPDYYLDTRQFRPRPGQERPGSASMQACVPCAHTFVEKISAEG